MKKNFLSGLFILFLSVYSVNFSAQCTADFTYTVGSNGSVTFSSTSVGTSSTTQYYWDFNDGATAVNYGIPTASHVYSYNQVFNVILTINDSINNQACWGTITKTVSVNNSSCSGSLSFSTYEGANGNIVFNNTSAGISSQASYTFFYGDGSSSNSWPSAGHTYSAAGVYTVNVTAAGAGCTYTAVQTVTVNYNVCPLNASFTYSIGTNGLVSFASTSTGTTVNTNIWWNFGDGNYGSGQSSSNQYLQSGTYNVNLMVSDSFNVSCSDTVTQTITLNNVCFASASFMMWKDSSQVPNIVYYAYPTYPANILAAEWNWGDGSTTLGLYPSHTFSATGVYNICLSVTVTCGSSTNTCSSSNIFRTVNNTSMQMASVNVVQSALGIKKNSGTADVSVYPNPSEGIYKVDIKGLERDAKIEIYSVFGERIFSSTCAPGKIMNVDISGKAPGYYFMKISDGVNSINKKIIVKP